jgi:cytochrome c biogenesis factor
MCFYIHTDSIDSRFGLSVGALFAVIGNKYIIDSALPESTTFTLVDTLHGITLLFILIVIICTSYSLKLVKQEKLDKARRFDLICAQVLLAAYLLLNTYFIYGASRI